MAVPLGPGCGSAGRLRALAAPGRLRGAGYCQLVGARGTREADWAREAPAWASHTASCNTPREWQGVRSSMEPGGLSSLKSCQYRGVVTCLIENQPLELGGH